jgi:hypothetical protein
MAWMFNSLVAETNCEVSDNSELLRMLIVRLRTFSRAASISSALFFVEAHELIFNWSSRLAFGFMSLSVRSRPR